MVATVGLVMPFSMVEYAVLTGTLVGALNEIVVVVVEYPVIATPRNVPPVNVVASVPAGKVMVMAAPVLITAPALVLPGAFRV